MGGGWGKYGYGLLPFAYYDSLAFEHYAQYFGHELRGFKRKRLDTDATRWRARDEYDRRMYAFEIGKASGDRIGWAFAVETRQAIELEELFVAPDHRRAGVGARLAEMVVGLSSAKRLPLRVWVRFADAPTESPQTGDALPKLARRLGVQFQPCPVRWAAYFATNEASGSDALPVPNIPGRPRSTLGALKAFALATNLSGDNGLPAVPQPPAAEVRTVVVAQDLSEWAVLNERRAALIRKKNRVGLDPAERAEFDRLQASARSRAEGAKPDGAATCHFERYKNRTLPGVY
jgi:GNAT superfamily N-acetyltransferase